jgi:hypothetical protein
MLRKRWEHLHKEAPKLAALLRLLSRFELTRDQAVRWFEKKDLTDAVLENPICFTSAIDMNLIRSGFGRLIAASSRLMTY